MTSMARDLIRVNDLLTNVLLHTGAHWPPKRAAPTPQPILISISIPHDVTEAALNDDLTKSINYSTISSKIRKSVTPVSSADLSPAFHSLESISHHIFDALLVSDSLDIPIVQEISLKIVQLKPPLHCKAVGLETSATAGVVDSLNYFLEDLVCHAIVGVNACEREEKQIVKFNISIQDVSGNFDRTQWLDFRALTRRLYEITGKSSYQTLESLASLIALETLQELRLSWASTASPLVTVSAAKPNALVFAGSAEVKISRQFADYPETFSTARAQVDKHESSHHTAAIALGSNLGDRFANIELALRLLEAPQNLFKVDDDDEERFVAVVDTSFMYESAPMYVTDQPAFINCACVVETTLKPRQLLNLLKKIESQVGRVPSIQNGPRAIDLDIVFYDDVAFDTRTSEDLSLTDELVVPHPKLAEREFVLRPLFDMIPDYVHPKTNKTVSSLLNELVVRSDDPPMLKVMPFPCYPTAPEDSSTSLISSVPSTLTHWTFPSRGNTQKAPSGSQPLRTQLMATLNATPDSFSDGSENNTLPAAMSYARDAARAGAAIIDVGGYSTRPGAAFVSAEEEIERVVPVISAIRNGGSAYAEGPLSDDSMQSSVRNVLISIDTFRPDVARSAILAGANCINDVYAFTGPDSYPFPSSQDDQKARADEYLVAMKSVAREYAVPVILMHSRGDAGKNKDYGEGPILERVREELVTKMDMIVKGKGCVRRWLVMLDPGIGFSKTVEGNLELLRSSAALTEDFSVGTVLNPLRGYPLLIGTSRKSFLGQILAENNGRDTQANERGWATAAAVACAVQQNAAVIRVHDTQQMADVVRVAEALWRRT